jgi:hypothetical protein
VADTKKKKVRTTVSLPKTIYEEARSFVEWEAGPAGSLNGLFVTAISAYLKFLKRRQIDSQFAAMASDAEYQKESKLISEQFSQSDWDAFELAEKER